MKTSWVVSVVVAAHCLVIVGVLCMQGCGTTSTPVATKPPEPVMPSTVAKPMPPPPKPSLPVAQPPVKTWPSETSTYTVQKGDSVSLIAARFHLSPAEVMGMNRITNPNKIFVGQKLTLPGKVDLNAPMPVKKAKPVAKKATEPKPAAASVAASSASAEGSYVVKPGDVLSRIAVRNGTTVAALRSANNLKSDRITVGQKLKLPGQSASSAPAATPTPTPAPVAPVPEAAPVSTTPALEMDGDADVTPMPGTDMPPLPATDVSTPASAPSAGAAPTAFRAHKVEPGEDLYHVSLMWDVKVEDLQRINGLSGTTLTPGQELKIPVPQ